MAFVKRIGQFYAKMWVTFRRLRRRHWTQLHFKIYNVQGTLLAGLWLFAHTIRYRTASKKFDIRWEISICKSNKCEKNRGKNEIYFAKTDIYGVIMVRRYEPPFWNEVLILLLFFSESNLRRKWFFGVGCVGGITFDLWPFTRARQSKLVDLSGLCNCGLWMSVNGKLNEIEAWFGWICYEKDTACNVWIIDWIIYQTDNSIVIFFCTWDPRFFCEKL